MRVAQLALVIFPLVLVGAIAGERLALLWLGADPASALAWEFWLSAHTAFGSIWQILEPAIGGSMFGHMLMLFIIATVFVLIVRSRRWPAYLFLGNHLALILALASSLVVTQPKMSSLVAGSASPGDWAVTWVAQFSAAQVLILLGGLISCLLSHLVLLRYFRERSQVAALRIRMLQQNL
jgi:hypothetical protein